MQTDNFCIKNIIICNNNNQNKNQIENIEQRKSNSIFETFKKQINSAIISLLSCFVSHRKLKANHTLRENISNAYV